MFFKRVLDILWSRFAWQQFVPQTFLSLRQGYNFQAFLRDLMAGLGVAIIAIPLSMAFAIASGLPPEVGLYTAIIGGFLVALFSGSPFQIGGPAGAFVVIIYDIIMRQGLEGLLFATLVAGIVMILMGLARVGTMLKFISYPVITGFTSGIALLIFFSQIKDFLGLTITKTPAHFVGKLSAYFNHIETLNPYAISVALGSLLLIGLIKRFVPRLPVFLIVLLIASGVVWGFSLPVATIGSTFGEVCCRFPALKLAPFQWSKLLDILPDAFTLAVLGATESLLCALVADSLSSTKHKTDCELVGQGIANIGCALFGGMPVTGTVSRTSANIRMGAKTPVAGMLHAVALLIFVLVCGRWIGHIPLAVLAAILMVIAWQMSDLKHIREIMKASFGEIVVMAVTFLLTVFQNLVVAVEAGVILSALVFIKHLTQKPTLKRTKQALRGAPEPELAKEVLMMELTGPIFFGMTEQFRSAVDELESMSQKTLVLRMRHVSMIDATGMQALKEFEKRCQQLGIQLLFTDTSEELQRRLVHSGFKSPS